ncbi:MAG: LamG domain-containing protein [Lentisphaerae bacterium]|nr:LamG domain-containing protein [Lentisphaerota bacterium]
MIMLKTLFTALCAAAAFAAFAEVPQMVGYWKLDDGEGKVIKSSVENVPAGTIFNVQNTKWVDGRKGGKALYFCGDPEKKKQGGCVRVPTKGFFDSSKPFSISFWAMPESREVMKRESNYELVSNTVSDRGPGLRICFAWNVANASSGDGKKSTGITAAEAKYPVKRSVWSHIALTYDGKVAKLYINGALANSKEMAITKGRDYFCIGSYCTGSAYSFQGAISDVKFYNAELTAGQVMAEAKNLNDEE